MSSGREAFLTLMALLCINILVHLPFLNMPPKGAHVWRQCNTMAMSRNFSEESANILEPRIDRRNNTNGITGSHFPLYEWCLGMIWKLTGHSEIVARIYACLISTFFLFTFYLLMRCFHHSELAIASSFLLLSVPQIYYDSINAMPDNLALGLALFSAYFIQKYTNGGTGILLVSGMITACLAGMIKFQFLIIPTAFLVQMISKPALFKRAVSGFILSCLPVILWYLHAMELTRLNNLKEFGLWIKSVDVDRVFKTIISNITVDLPELLTGWPMFISLIIFLIPGIRKFRAGNINRVYLIWLLGILVFYILAIERMLHHSYYLMILIPLILWFTINLYKKAKLPLSGIIFICILNITWSMVRIIPSRWISKNESVPHDLLEARSREMLSNSVPAGSLVLCGPDVSGCIFLYFLHFKGYTFEDAQELYDLKRKPVLINEMYEKGMRYMVLRKTTESTLLLQKIGNRQLISETKEFSIWRLDGFPVGKTNPHPVN